MGSWMLRPVALLGVLGLSLGLVAGCIKASESVAPEEFYRGKTVVLVSSSNTGGTVDLFTRAIAPYLAKEMGATTRVENMGSDETQNYIFEDAPRDGLMLVFDNTGAVLSNDLLKAPGVKYETEKFNFLADVNPTNAIFQVSPKLAARTIDALRQAKGLKAGGTSARGSLAVNSAVATELLGLDAKVVTGYDGKKAATMALARGEVDFFVGTDASAQKDESDGYIVNLFALASQRSLLIPNVPTIFELGWKVPKELEGPFGYLGLGGTSAILPPGVSQDRVDYLRKMFQKLGDDKELLKEREKIASGPPSAFILGKELQDRMIKMKGDKALAKQLEDIFTRHKAVQ